MEGAQGFFSALSTWLLGSDKPAQGFSRPKTNTSRPEPRSIEPIPLRYLLSSPQADFTVLTKDDLQGTVTDQLYQELSTRGFVVLSIEDSADSPLSILLQLRERSRQFFALDVQEKEKRLAKFAGENRGYVLIPEIREYLKLRIEDMEHDLVSEEGHGFKDSFVPTFNELSEILWLVFVHLYHAARVRFFKGEELGGERPLLSKSELDETKECILERSYVSIIHYFARGGEIEEEGEDAKENEQTESEREKEKEDEKEDGGNMTKKKRCVCSTHTDTGILTGILCADMPALEVLDEDSAQWIRVEERLHERKAREPQEAAYLVIIMGEKAPLFTGTKELHPTKHRVNLWSSESRESLLFFMDTSKGT